ncbi:MAG: DMT family transporter [Pseudomonadota bacterium]
MTPATAIPAASFPPAALGVALGALAVLCWASFNVAAVHGLQAGLHPIDLTLLRFGTAGLVLAPALALLRRHDRTWNAWPSLERAVALALLGGPLFGALAVGGYAFAPLSHGMVFGPAAVFVVGLGLAFAVTGERVGSRKIAGGVVVLAGLVVLSKAAIGEVGAGAWHGDALFIAAGAMWAAFTVLMRLWSVEPLRGTLMVGVISSLLAPPVFGVAILWGATSGLATTPGTETLLQAAVQGLVGGVLSVVTLMGAVRLLGAATAALLPSFAPVAALGLAVPVLGDWPSGTEAAGVAIAVAGLVLANLRPAQWATSPRGGPAQTDTGRDTAMVRSPC